MPLKSKAQRRKFKVLEDAGKLERGTTERLTEKALGKKLPERVAPKGKRK